MMEDTGEITRPDMLLGVIGDSGSGKSSLLHTAATGKPVIIGETTLGSEAHTVKTTLETQDNGRVEKKEFTIAIIGFGGQRDYIPLIRASDSLRAADAVLLCFDLSNPDTFNRLPIFIEILVEKYGDNKIPVILTGLKNDLTWAVPHRQIMEFLNENRDIDIRQFVWCSAKNYENVHGPFNAAVASHLGQVNYRPVLPAFTEKSRSREPVLHETTFSVACTYTGCTKQVLFKVTGQDLKRAEESSSGMADIVTVCYGNSVLDVPHLVRLKIDKNGDHRAEGEAVIAPSDYFKKLSYDDRILIIMQKNIVKGIKGKENQLRKLDDTMERFDNLLAKKWPKLHAKRKERKALTNIHSLLTRDPAWKSLPSINGELDPRLTLIDAADFFLWFYMKKLQIPKKKRDEYFKGFKR